MTEFITLDYLARSVDAADVCVWNAKDCSRFLGAHALTLGEIIHLSLQNKRIQPHSGGNKRGAGGPARGWACAYVACARAISTKRGSAFVSTSNNSRFSSRYATENFGSCWTMLDVLLIRSAHLMV